MLFIPQKKYQSAWRRLRKLDELSDIISKKVQTCAVYGIEKEKISEWMVLYQGVGGDSNKPSVNDRFIGMQYFNTKLNKPTWWDGTNWVDSTGTVV